MDRRLAKQQIGHQKAEAIARYSDMWSKQIAEWSSDHSDDRAWLIYSANYLLRTANVRWAIDPVTLQNRLSKAPAVDVSLLNRLSFVLLTHSHADHLDLPLIKALRHFDIQWVIPPDVLKVISAKMELPLSRVHIPRYGEDFQIDGLQVMPFQGIHWQRGYPGVPTTAYLVTFNDKRWLFPGDIRTYDARLLPDFSPIDGVFAHLWLGRGCALMDEPPMLRSFCNFYLYLQPKRIIIAHLQEFGRSAKDYWDSRHCNQVIQCFERIKPNLPVTCVHVGESVLF